MSITDELRKWAHGFTEPYKRNEQQLLAIADRIDTEHDATLGRGTCHPVEQYIDMHSDLTVTVCSSCGVPEDELADMNYCPNCGARVVEVGE